MRIPPDSPRGQKAWLGAGKFLGYWTIGVALLIFMLIVVMLVLHFTGIVHFADS